MKKKCLTILSLFVLIGAYAQDARSVQSYVDANALAQEASAKQEEGYYEESIAKSEEALTALDVAILDASQRLMQLRTSVAQDDADKNIATAKTLGSAADSDYKAQFDAEIIKYDAAVAMIPAADEVKASEEDISAAYSPIIDEFVAVSDAVKRINDSYFTREQQKGSALIGDARKKYTALTGNKTIVKGSSDDTKVSNILSSADSALQEGAFANVATQVKTANDLMASIEKAFAAKKAQTQKSINDANARFSKLKSSKVIASGSADDKNISGLLGKATSSLNSGDLTAADQSVSSSLSAMNNAETAHKKAVADAQKAIADATAKQKELNEKGIMPTDSMDNSNVSSLIALANKSIGSGDAVTAQENAKGALDTMKTIEANYLALSKTAQDLIAQAKSEQKALVAEYPGADSKPEYTSISEDISIADTFFAEQVFTDAQTSAQSALDKIAQFKVVLAENAALYTADGKYKILPKYYTVRARNPLSQTDCLWRISEYSFIYGDRDAWQPIFDLNKASFPRANDPHLIYPGQVLEIPSTKGERREGTYDPDVNYIDFSDAE